MRSAQRVAVSVAILTAATLVMALAMYSYFTSHYAESSLESKLELVKTRILGSISFSITHSTSQQAGSYWAGCYMVKVHNRGDSHLTMYYTVMPVETLGASILIGGNVTVIPVDQYTGDQTVFTYLLGDVDLDGLVDTIGYSNGTQIKLEPSPLDDCSLVAVNDTLRGLAIPPSEYAGPVSIIMEDLTIEELLVPVNTSLSHPLPLWRLSLEPGESIHLLLALATPSGPPADMDLVILARVGDTYHYVDSIDLG